LRGALQRQLQRQLHRLLLLLLMLLLLLLLLPPPPTLRQCICAPRRGKCPQHACELLHLLLQRGRPPLRLTAACNLLQRPELHRHLRAIDAAFEVQ
jgi:hypothetical protein